MADLFINGYAIDLSKDSLTESDCYDSKALLQAVENIILTIPGERIFQPEFGTSLMTSVFKNINSERGEVLLDSIISSINKFEPRVRVISKQCGMDINPSENSLTIKIVFVALKSGKVIQYTKKIQS